MSAVASVTFAIFFVFAPDGRVGLFSDNAPGYKTCQQVTVPADVAKIAAAFPGVKIKPLCLSVEQP